MRAFGVEDQTVEQREEVGFHMEAVGDVSFLKIESCLEQLSGQVMKMAKNYDSQVKRIALSP